MVSVHIPLHYLVVSPWRAKKPRLSLPGYNYSGGFGYLGTSPKGLRATTWSMDPVTSHHFTGHTTDAKRVSAGGSGKMARVTPKQRGDHVARASQHEATHTLGKTIEEEQEKGYLVQHKLY
jgi:hypothetical protein